MPIYQFRCGKCGAHKEEFIEIHKYLKRQRCTKCRRKMDRLYSTFNTSTNTVLSDKTKEDLSVPFGKSARNMNTVGDLQKHINKLNREYGLTLDYLTTNW